MFICGMSKTIFALILSVVLAACSTEENYTGSLDGGTGVIGDGGVILEGTQSIALSWVAPVEREDGTPISMADIAGYRVYFGIREGEYTNEVDVHGSDNMQVSVDRLPTGTYYIVVTTVDSDGRESAYSETIIASV
jgi:hypothetical protein